MSQNTSLALTPEQIAAVNQADGPIYVHDPATLRRFVLVEEPPTERLTVEELRAMLQEAIDQSDRGECRPWDPEEIKEEIRKHYAQRGIS